MHDNAYKPPTTVDGLGRTKGIRWAIWAGIICLLAATICGVLTIAGMILTFQTVDDVSGRPTPELLAEGISYASIPAYGIVPFGLAGTILVIIGLAVRRPIQQCDRGLSKQEIDRAILLSLTKPKNERGQVFSAALKEVKHKPRFIVDAYLELRKMKTGVSKFDMMRCHNDERSSADIYRAGVHLSRILDRG